MRKLVAGLATTAALALVAATPSPATAHGRDHHGSSGDRSLAAVLTSDGNWFDRNWSDYDIVTEAVLAVLASKPQSPVKVLTDGSVPVTAFIPTDRAFQHLVRSLTGKTPRTEQKAFAAVAGLGIDTVETVLLYHVVPGATITYKQAVKADGAVLKTAQGGSVTVDVRHWWRFKQVRLQDLDPNARDPRVVAPDINKGNKQIAHGIDRVLRPADL